MSIVKKKRGQKTCVECDAINGVRAFVCKECGSEFKMKKGRIRPHNVLVEDHTTLERGDIIKVVGNSGPYYTEENGEKTYLVDRGSYTVVRTYADGIQVTGESGHGYLYMGKTCPSKLVDSITQAPCKVQKVYQPNHTKQNPR